MQIIPSLFKRWDDSVPDLARITTAIGGVILVECLAFFLKGNMPSRIHALLLARAIDVPILLYGNPGILDEEKIRKVFWKSAVISISAGTIGLIFLLFWKQMSGQSFLRGEYILKLRQSPSLMIVYLVTACIVSPIAEELLFRGILYRKARKRLNFWIVTLSVSILFSFIHLYFSGSWLMPFAGSLIFCLGYEITHHVLTPIMLHMVGNLIITISPLLGFL